MYSFFECGCNGISSELWLYTNINNCDREECKPGQQKHSFQPKK